MGYGFILYSKITINLIVFKMICDNLEIYKKNKT